MVARITERFINSKHSLDVLSLIVEGVEMMIIEYTRKRGRRRRKAGAGKDDSNDFIKRLHRMHLCGFDEIQTLTRTFGLSWRRLNAN